jgi:4-amino-4-deoxy-L-arabinose transferase-like glycosyltransferase
MEIMNVFSIPGSNERQRVDRMEEPGLNRFKPWQIVLLILLMAFTLRLLLVLQPEVIRNDGVEYVRHAKQIMAGNWVEGKSGPVYPAFIALAYSLIKNYELAGIWVSVIFGALLVLPVFYLGRTLFNEKVGILSALLAAVHPFLYIYSGSVLTESIYSFFIATSVLFGWYAFSGGKFLQILLFSLFVSLTYLTRPEGIGILFVFCVWALLVNPPGKKRVWRKRAGVIFLSIFCFLLFSSPYLLQLRKELGSWQISKKTVFSAGSPSEEDSDLKEVGKRDKINVGTFLKEPLVILGTMGIGLLESLYKFQQAFNPLLFLLAIVGWIKIFRVKSSHLFKGNLYILSNHVFFFTFVLPVFWVLRRYTSHMNAISIPWAAFGFLEVLEWIKRRVDRESLRKTVSLVLLLLLLSGLFVQARVRQKREQRFIQKEAGLWVKDHLPRSGKIMSRMPQEAFYAELPWLLTPKGSYEKILERARFDGATYLIVDENVEKRSPGFWGKLDEKDLILIKEIRKKNWRMVIFEIVYPKGKKP